MRFSQRYLIGVLSTVVLLALPDTAATQNVYADQVQGYLDESESRLLGSDYSLEPGTYGGVAVCDYDCSTASCGYGFRLYRQDQN